MEELQKFYKRFLKSLCLDVEDDVVMVGNSKLMVQGYPLELYNVNKRYLIDGEIRAVIFNPLYENLIRYRNQSKEPITNKILKIIELNLNLTLKSILVSFVQNQINKVDYDFKTVRSNGKFFSTVEGAKKASKKLYDETMLSNYIKLLESGDKIVSLHYRTNIEVDGEKVPSAMVIKHKLLESIESETVKELYPKYRRIDSEVLIAYLEHINDMFGTRLGYSVLAKHTVATTLIKSIVKITDVLDEIEPIATPDSGYVSMFNKALTYNDVKKLSSFTSMASAIPYIDIKDKTEIRYEQQEDTDTSEEESNNGTNIVPLSDIIPQQQMPQQQLQQQYVMPQQQTPQQMQQQKTYPYVDNYGNVINLMNGIEMVVAQNTQNGQMPVTPYVYGKGPQQNQQVPQYSYNVPPQQTQQYPQAQQAYPQYMQQGYIPQQQNTKITRTSIP